MMGTDSDKQDIPHPASRELFDVFDSRDDLQQMRKSLKKNIFFKPKKKIKRF